uniref:Uncharacterized protein n=1 Tax=Siphoviridae sp. ctYh54 TaxID=2826379 RepID=A0A8S5ME28_9CAUD|nr:MAG TPA: hypothetical protein [Siphoviridae sp. ctYh54]
MLLTKKLEDRVSKIEKEVLLLKNTDKSDSSLFAILGSVLAFMPSGNQISKFEFDSLRERYHALDKRLSLLESKDPKCKKCQE